MKEKNKKDYQNSKLNILNFKFQTLTSDYKGITLIALVVTIIVLLILAGVTINIVLSEGGLFSRATQASDSQKMAELRDQMEIMVADWLIDKKTDTTNSVDEQDYFSKLIAAGIATQDEISGPTESGTDKEYEITTTDGYVAEVTVDEKGNIIIGQIVKGDNLPPKIKAINVTEITNDSITAKVEVTRIEGGEVTYYYKKAGEADYTEITNVVNGEVKLTGLTKGDKYIIKVEATNANTQIPVSKETEEITVEEIVLITGITLSPAETTEIDQGDTLEITATIAPSNATVNGVEWETEDEAKVKINTVEGNKVTVEGVGATTEGVKIIAKATDRDGQEKRAEVIIKVKPTPAAEFTRNASEGDIDVVFVNTSNTVISEPEVPTINNNMVPVKWDGSSWVVCEANSNWYNYANKEWANIMLRDGLVVEGITDATDVNVATVASMAGKKVTSVGSMYVYIPRYAYKITYYDANGVVIGYSNSNGITSTNEEQIVEGTEKTNAIAVNKSTTEKYYVVHPAFRSDSSNTYKNGEWNEEISGIWVGKFEASFADSGTTESSGRYTGTDKVLQSKPGVASWRNNPVNNIYTVCKNYTGINTTGSHMMKNSEWGAVAYLAQSTYGKNAEVWINPNSNYLTGHAGTGASVNGTTSTTDYTSTNGQQASTTGNVYGIYDMSGCGYEYVASYVNNGHDNITNASYGGVIGDTNTSNSPLHLKQVYGSKGSGGTSDRATDYEYNKAVYGDAVYETSANGTTSNGSWYDDYSNFPVSSNPFFPRGGGSGVTSGAGLFCFVNYGGSAITGIGFRVVSSAL